MHDTGFTKQAQSRGTQNVVDGLGRRSGRLPHALALPRVKTVAAVDVEPGRQLHPGTTRRTGDHRNVDVRRVDRQRHVRAITHFTSEGNPGDRLDAIEADAVQTNVFRKRGRVARCLDAAGEGSANGGVFRIEGEVRQTRVIVDEVDRRLGIVQRRDHLTQCEAELAIVGR
ncbi:hypothetical protein D3C72_1627490 [compost metagenome]